jgi:RNA polymerase sigma-70 factor, ECF subfamily
LFHSGACNQPPVPQVSIGDGPEHHGQHLVEGGDRVDREEFTSFYAATFQRLVGQLYAMTGDQAEAQDAVQEAFVRAWARRGMIERDGAPEAWVRVTAWRIAASRWRRARDGSQLMLLNARPESTAGPTPDRVAFVEALRRLPAEKRRALVLYHLCDLTVDQIAAETGVPAGTVKARLARGRAAIKPYLRDTAAPVTS